MTKPPALSVDARRAVLLVAAATLVVIGACLPKHEPWRVQPPQRACGDPLCDKGGVLTYIDPETGRQVSIHVH